MRRAAAALVAAAAVLAGCGGTKSDGVAPVGRPPTERQQTGPAPITEAAIAEHLRALERIADRNDGNRAAGTKGGRETAEYVAARLRAAGWRVQFQNVTIAGFRVTGTPRLAGLTYRDDFDVLRYSAPARLTLRPRPFDTLGCRASELGDLEKRDLAIVARGTCPFRQKALAAQEAGAGGLAVVDEEQPEPVRATLGDPAGIDIPVFAVNGPAATRLAKAGRPVAVDLETKGGDETSRNVIADNGGSGPAVMAGAHLDSVAAGPGINDDGTGIASLLAIAAREKRTGHLRLGFWTAEELGLFGSRRYAGALTPKQRKEISGYLNLDMVGSPNAKVVVYGDGKAMKKAVEDAFGRDVPQIDIGAVADHGPFEEAGIPTAGIYSGGDEPGPGGKDRDECYHRACDTVRHADARLAARLTRVADEALVSLARAARPR